jgi:hypothetical protein
MNGDSISATKAPDGEMRELLEQFGCGPTEANNV